MHAERGRREGCVAGLGVGWVVLRLLLLLLLLEMGLLCEMRIGARETGWPVPGDRGWHCSAIQIGVRCDYDCDSRG